MLRSVVSLESRWLWAWETLKLTGDPLKEFGWVIERYCETHRRYHLPDHLLDGLEAFELFVEDNPGLLKPWEIALVILAFFWHDETWKTTTPDWLNVAASALGAYQFGQRTGMSKRRCLILRRLVKVTNHKTTPKTLLGKIIFCLDVAILGSEWSVYLWYGRFVRQEYSQYTDAQWQMGRPSFMEKLAAQELYPLPYFKAKYGPRAKENIEREIGLLRSGQSL